MRPAKFLYRPMRAPPTSVSGPHRDHRQSGVRGKLFAILVAPLITARVIADLVGPLQGAGPRARSEEDAGCSARETVAAYCRTRGLSWPFVRRPLSPSRGRGRRSRRARRLPRAAVRLELRRPCVDVEGIHEHELRQRVDPGRPRPRRASGLRGLPAWNRAPVSAAGRCSMSAQMRAVSARAPWRPCSAGFARTRRRRSRSSAPVWVLPETASARSRPTR